MGIIPCDISQKGKLFHGVMTNGFRQTTCALVTPITLVMFPVKNGRPIKK